MPHNLPDTCPRCGGGETVQGEILSQGVVLPGIVFRPRHRKWWSVLLPDPGVAADACACLDCGLLWTDVRTALLKKVTK